MIDIDEPSVVPDEVNALHVWVAATKTPVSEPEICEPIKGIIQLSSPNDLPVVTTIEQGPTYSVALFYSVQGTLDEEIVHQGTTGIAEWPTSSTGEKRVTLVTACMGQDCGDLEECTIRDEESHCIPAPDERLFIDSSYWTDDSCLAP